MLASFLDSLGGVLDRRFLVTYWAPVFLGIGLLGAVAALERGPALLVGGWLALRGVEQALAGFGALLAVTVAAYLLQALTTSTMRWYEGYTFPRLLAEWAIEQQRTDLARYEGAPEEAGPGFGSRLGEYGRYLLFPGRTRDLRPTRLGNVLAAAEEHPSRLIGMDAVHWWPRLAPLLPGELRGQIDAALVPVIALLNFTTLLTFTAVVGGAYVAARDDRWWLFLLVFGGGLGLARLCYSAAVAQAVEYGLLLRAAFDLHRHAVLRQMGIAVPLNREDERLLWILLGDWIYSYVPPDANPKSAQRGIMRDWMKPPFDYAGPGREPPAAEPGGWRGWPAAVLRLVGRKRGG